MKAFIIFALLLISSGSFACDTEVYISSARHEISRMAIERVKGSMDLEVYHTEYGIKHRIAEEVLKIVVEDYYCHGHSKSRNVTEDIMTGYVTLDDVNEILGMLN